MARKQFGMMDDALIAELDARADELGPTRAPRSRLSIGTGHGVVAMTRPVEPKPKVCPVCGTEATRVAGRRRGTAYWWCWRCEKAIRPVESEELE